MLLVLAVPYFAWLMFHRLVQVWGFSDEFPGALVTGTLALLEGTLGALVVSMTWNYVRAAYIYVRLFGWPSKATMEQMWYVKDRSVRGFSFDFTGKLHRVPTAQAIVVGTWYAAAPTLLAAVVWTHWSRDLFLCLGAVFLSVIPTNYLFHGRPPAVLLLGSSGREALSLQRYLVERFARVGVVSLLRPEVGDTTSLTVLAGSHLRAREPFSEDWPEIFQRLASFAHAIVVDCRGRSEAVADELVWLKINGHTSKVLLFGPDSANYPEWPSAAENTSDQNRCRTFIMQRLGLGRFDRLIAYPFVAMWARREEPSNAEAS